MPSDTLLFEAQFGIFDPGQVTFDPEPQQRDQMTSRRTHIVKTRREGVDYNYASAITSCTLTYLPSTKIDQERKLDLHEHESDTNCRRPGATSTLHAPPPPHNSPTPTFFQISICPRHEMRC